MSQKKIEQLKKASCILHVVKQMVRRGDLTIAGEKEEKLKIELSILAVLKKLRGYFNILIEPGILKEMEAGIKFVYKVSDTIEMDIEEALLNIEELKKDIGRGDVKFGRYLGEHENGMTEALETNMRRASICSIVQIEQEIMGREELSQECIQILNQSKEAVLKEFGSLKIPIF